jgi:hypothetical protein
MTTATVAKNLKGTYGTMYFVKDMQKSVAWFRGNFGLVPSFESAEWTEFPIQGGTSICLHNIDSQQKHNTSGFVILRVDNIRDVVADLQKKDVRTDEIKEVCPGAQAANIYDLDGNVISLYDGPA